MRGVEAERPGREGKEADTSVLRRSCLLGAPGSFVPPAPVLPI